MTQHAGSPLGGRRRLPYWIAALSLVASLAAVAAAYASPGAPHVAQTVDTDTCAMCHRVKTSLTDVKTEFSRATATSTGDAADLRNALLVGAPSTSDDTGLCFSCHGVERMGSAIDVQSSFESSSGHLLAPANSAYGRSPKQCSTCHDSHGENRVAGVSRPGLLRSIVTTTAIYYTGDAYCASCHPDRPADTWDGLAVWNKTAHARVLPSPSSGTAIICSVCHDPHGSSIAPTIKRTLAPPAVLSSMTVAANDRTLCLLCHSASKESWVGSATYAPSAHGSSAATIAISGEWVARDLTSREASRVVGECQVCHAPMGRSDGTSGGVIPKMANKKGRQLCDDCHDADGPARSNIASLAFPASRADIEVVAVWRPSTETSIYGDAALYTRDVTATVPAALDGPRVFKPSFRTGDASAGDIDGDGRAELVVGDPSRPYVDVYKSDPVRGLKRITLALPDGAKPYLVTLGNIVQHGSGPHGAQDTRAEIAVINRAATPPHASTLHLYTFDGSALEDILKTPLAAGGDASSLASGDVTGTARADLVVTASGDDQFRIFTEGAATVHLASGPHATGAGTKPRGASVGDVWAGLAGQEIVICNSGVAANNVALFSGSGTALATYTTSGNVGANVAYDSVVADPLWNVSPTGTSGLEVAVTLRSDPSTDGVDATSSIDLFPQVAFPGTGLSVADRLNYATGARYESSAIEAGDIDNDGHAELVVGNAGKWLRLGIRQAPSLQVFDSAAGSTLALSRTLWSTGVEQASGIQETTTTALGTAPSVVIADLGAVGPARHPGDAGTATHVSTETAPVARHVTCADCHNPHETTATVPASPATVYGALKGAWGTTILNTGAGNAITFAAKRSVTTEYEVCLKCHSAYSDLDGTRNVASEVNTRNASTHAVEGPSDTASVPASTFETPSAGQFRNSASVWTKNSMLYCIDCHANSDTAQARGPHVSGEGSLLRAPVWGVTASDSGLLCYLCHKRSVYYGGGTGSLFSHPNKPDMHKLHTQDTGFSCRTCHVSHGSAGLSHLQNADHNYEHTAQGGACATECHTGGARHAYTRGSVTLADDVSVVGASATGVTVPTISTRDSADLVVTEPNGTSPAYSVEITFSPGAMPSGVEFYGQYSGSPGHIVRAQAWDYSSALSDKWTNVGTWPSTGVRGTFSFALANPGFFSGGTVRVRLVHTSPGNPNHRHYVDSVWLTP